MHARLVRIARDLAGIRAPRQDRANDNGVARHTGTCGHDHVVADPQPRRGGESRVNGNCSGRCRNLEKDGQDERSHCETGCGKQETPCGYPARLVTPQRSSAIDR